MDDINAQPDTWLNCRTATTPNICIELVVEGWSLYSYCILAIYGTMEVHGSTTDMLRQLVIFMVHGIVLFSPAVEWLWNERWRSALQLVLHGLVVSIREQCVLQARVRFLISSPRGKLQAHLLFTTARSRLAIALTVAQQGFSFTLEEAFSFLPEPKKTMY